MCAFILHIRACSVPLELVVNCFKLVIPIMREVKDKQKICSLMAQLSTGFIWQEFCVDNVVLASGTPKRSKCGIILRGYFFYKLTRESFVHSS